MTLDLNNNPRLGMGCWAIGGPFWAGDAPLGWGEVDDGESIRAIHAALDTGARYFDTASVYGAGHSEVVLGAALKGREDVIISTKIGNLFDAKSKQVTGNVATREEAVREIEGCLRRLGRASGRSFLAGGNGTAIPRHPVLKWGAPNPFPYLRRK